MSYSLKLSITELALLDGYCRAAGTTLRAALVAHLNRTATATAPAPVAPVAPAAPAAPAPEPCQILTAEESADAFNNSLISLA